MEPKSGPGEDSPIVANDSTSMMMDIDTSVGDNEQQHPLEFGNDMQTQQLPLEGNQEQQQPDVAIDNGTVLKNEDKLGNMKQESNIEANENNDITSSQQEETLDSVMKQEDLVAKNEDGDGDTEKSVNKSGNTASVKSEAEKAIIGTDDKSQHVEPVLENSNSKNQDQNVTGDVDPSDDTPTPKAVPAPSPGSEPHADSAPSSSHDSVPRTAPANASPPSSTPVSTQAANHLGHASTQAAPTTAPSPTQAKANLTTAPATPPSPTPASTQATTKLAPEPKHTPGHTQAAPTTAPSTTASVPSPTPESAQAAANHTPASTTEPSPTQAATTAPSPTQAAPTTDPSRTQAMTNAAPVAATASAPSPTAASAHAASDLAPGTTPGMDNEPLSSSKLDSKAHPPSGTIRPSPNVTSLLYRLQEAQLALTTAANRRLQKSNQAAMGASELPPSQRELLAANASTVRSLQQNAKTIAFNLERKKQEASPAADEVKGATTNVSSIPVAMETDSTNKGSKKEKSLPTESSKESSVLPADKVPDPEKSQSDSQSLIGENKTSGPDSPGDESGTDSTPIIIDEELLRSDEVLEPFDLGPVEAPMERLEKARKAAYLKEMPPIEQTFEGAQSTYLTPAPPKPNQPRDPRYQAAVAAAKRGTHSGKSPGRVTTKKVSSPTNPALSKQFANASSRSGQQRSSQSFPPKYVTHPNDDNNNKTATVNSSNLRKLPSSTKQKRQSKSPPRPARPVKHPSPAGPTAPLKPIRRLAKIRPYANQAIAFSQEQILNAIPNDASSVFHIMDRRVNFDAYDNNSHDDPRKDVPIYSLLRAWVQDDPYRQIPPPDPYLHRVTECKTKHKNQPVNNRKRARDESSGPTELDKGEERVRADVVGYLASIQYQETLPIPPTLPAQETLKREMVQQARGNKDSKQRRYNKQLKKTLKGLRKRGIVLNC